jgi:hypothetical protein
MKKKMLMWGLVVIEMVGVVCNARLNKCNRMRVGSICVYKWMVCLHRTVILRLNVIAHHHETQCKQSTYTANTCGS